MNLSTFFLGFALVAAIVGIACSMAIVAFVRKRGETVNWFFLKIMLFKYIRRYRAITIQETGKPGPLFYAYVIAMNMALIAAVVGSTLR